MITLEQVKLFKNEYCEENQIIIHLINSNLQNYFLESILDVGCGMGDIAYACWKNKKAYLIDTNPIEKEGSVYHDKHQYIQCDFYKFYAEDVSTIFVSHTLQFIDHNLTKLTLRLQLLNPRYIIIIVNENQDFLGKLVRWVKKKYPDAHPEEPLKKDIPNYALISQLSFDTQLVCKEFSQLAEQIRYMMLIPVEDDLDLLVNWLKQNLTDPTINFKQSIDIYEKNC
ncbi:MAG: hypothetical protein GC181_10720 [Bacteroidetes bacterium]|nr:hypothetical protein [Bacteroidota bacterium]